MSYPNNPFPGDPTDNPYASPQVEMFLPPGVQWVQAGSPSLRQTGVGLGLVYYGIVLVLLSALVAVFAGVTVAAARSPLVLLVVAAAGIGVFVGVILNFVGPLVCLVVPAESGAKGLIVGSVVCQLANLLGSVVSAVAPRLIPRPLSMVLGLFGLISAILFVLFMKKLSEYIGRPDLAARARNLLIIAAALFVVSIVVMVGFAAFAAATASGTAGPNGLAGLTLVPMLVLGIGGLIVFVMYVNLIDALRKALRGT